MNKRVALISTLVVVVWAVVGAFASADAYVLRISNDTGVEIQVWVFDQEDQLKWVPCEDKIIKKGQTIEVPNHGWPGCGAYHKFTIKAWELEWYGGDTPRYNLIWEGQNVSKGAHVRITK